MNSENNGDVVALGIVFKRFSGKNIVWVQRSVAQQLMKAFVGYQTTKSDVVRVSPIGYLTNGAEYTMVYDLSEIALMSMEEKY